MSQGTLEATHPAVQVVADGNGKAGFTIDGGLGYIPITISGLRSNSPYDLRVDGEVLDQSVHGNDFWQCDFDPDAQSWSMTYNVPMGGKLIREIEFAPGR